MPPPELAGNAPVADVVHPLVPGFDPILGNDLDALVIDRGNRFRRQWLRCHEPLLRHQRLDRRFAARTLAEVQRVIFDARQQPKLLDIFHDTFPRFLARKPGIRAALRGDLRVVINHLNQRQAMPLAGLEIVHVVRRRNFHHTGAELRIGDVVENDRNLALHQRQHHLAPMQVGIAFVARIDCDCCIAQHRLGSRRRHHQITIGAYHRITDVPKMPRRLFVHRLQIGNRRLASRAPVDHVLAAIDQAFFVKADKRFAHGARQTRIEREAFARPVARRSQLDHLPLDRAARLRFPLPHPCFECLAAHLASLQAFLGKLALHDHLRRDPGVIRARQPQRHIAAHAMPAHRDIDLSVLQHVPHMERTGNVRRRNDKRKYRLARLPFSAINAALHPPLSPARFEPLRLIHLF